MGKKSVDTNDRLDQVAIMREHGYLPTSEIAEKMGITGTTVSRWAESELVESELVGNRRFVKIDSLLQHIGPVQAAIFFPELIPTKVPEKGGRR